MSLRLILVEDNRLNCELARDLLEHAGHSVQVAMSGAEFRALLARSAPVDMILMDVLLPDSDGVTLLKEARREERLRSVPVVALTAQALFGDAERFVSEGFSAVLTKPINTRTFVADIEGWAR